MKQRTSIKISLTLLFFIVIIVATILLIFTIVKPAHASESEYSDCYHRCLLEVPTVQECIYNDDEFWEYGRNKTKAIRKECIAIVRDEKFNCKLDCYTETMMPKDPKRERAIKFWDRSVRSFPETNY
jgi:hypothetical protein